MAIDCLNIGANSGNADFSSCNCNSKCMDTQMTAPNPNCNCGITYSMPVTQTMPSMPPSYLQGHTMPLGYAMPPIANSAVPMFPTFPPMPMPIPCMFPPFSQQEVRHQPPQTSSGQSYSTSYSTPYPTPYQMPFMGAPPPFNSHGRQNDTLMPDVQSVSYQVQYTFAKEDDMGPHSSVPPNIYEMRQPNSNLHRTYEGNSYSDVRDPFKTKSNDSKPIIIDSKTTVNDDLDEAKKGKLITIKRDAKKKRKRKAGSGSGAGTSKSKKQLCRQAKQRAAELERLLNERSKFRVNEPLSGIGCSSASSLGSEMANLYQSIGRAVVAAANLSAPIDEELKDLAHKATKSELRLQTSANIGPMQSSSIYPHTILLSKAVQQPILHHSLSRQTNKTLLSGAKRIIRNRDTLNESSTQTGDKDNLTTAKVVKQAANNKPALNAKSVKDKGKGLGVAKVPGISPRTVLKNSKEHAKDPVMQSVKPRRHNSKSPEVMNNSLSPVEQLMTLPIAAHQALVPITLVESGMAVIPNVYPTIIVRSNGIDPRDASYEDSEDEAVLEAKVKSNQSLRMEQITKNEEDDQLSINGSIRSLQPIEKPLAASVSKLGSSNSDSDSTTCCSEASCQEFSETPPMDHKKILHTTGTSPSPSAENLNNKDTTCRQINPACYASRPQFMCRKCPTYSCLYYYRQPSCRGISPHRTCSNKCVRACRPWCCK